MTETVAEMVPEVEAVANYWGTDEKHKHYLPDGIQYFEFKIMNEGDKSKFQKLTNSDLVVGRDQTAKVKMDPVAERHTLIETSVTDWNLYMPKKDGSGMEQATFNSTMLKNWLQVAPPKIVEDLEFAIRKANPWMQAEQTVEMIDEEIERLYELRKSALEREAGEGDSASK
ncbi:MAG: tail assembly chaperone [Phage AS32]|nr:MAG: tail assembly chaperone [Phage AS32]